MKFVSESKSVVETALRLSAAATGMALLAGCALPVKDRSAESIVAPPSNWTALSDVGAVGTGWMHDFEDAQLRAVLEEALRHNYSLKAAAARLESARAGAVIGGAARWPQIELSVDGSRRKRSGTSGFAITSAISDSFNLGGSVSWEIGLWGKLNHRHRASIADWQASQADYYGARLSLAGATARAWFNAIESDLQLRLARDTVASFEKNLTVVQEGFERGINPALDLRLTRANVESARSTLQQRLRQHDVAVRTLEIIIGRYPAGRIKHSEALPRLRSGVPAGLPSELLQRRPDLVAAERRLEALSHRSQEAQKARLPSIRLTGSGGTSSNEFDSLLNSDFSVWAIAGGITQPLFQGGRLKAGGKRAEANYRESAANFAQTALRAFREVESALTASVYLREEEAALGAASEESIGAEELAWERYQKGLTDIITVLESQRRSFTARRTLLQISNQRLQNRIDLYLALGGDFGLPVIGPAVGFLRDDQSTGKAYPRKPERVPKLKPAEPTEPTDPTN